MKFAALVFALMLVGTLAHADVIPGGSHPVSRCVKVTNLDSYPDIYLIGEIMPVGNQAAQLSIIEQGACLSKGYKFNTFNIYYADKNEIDSLGGLDKLNTTRKIHEPTAESEGSLRPDFLVAADPLLHFITNQIEPYGGYVLDSDPTTNETIEYIMVKTSSGYTLQLESETMPPAPPDTPTPKPENAPTPLEAFWCWLMSIFGQNCPAYTR